MKHKDEIIVKALDVLREHFDAAEIIISTSTEDGDNNTVMCSLGFGNFHARYGAVSEWKAFNDERQKQYIRKNE